jgi:SNF2 family DNA or RNA helicase
MRTFGSLSLKAVTSSKLSWILEDVEPHVAIRLKNSFPRIPKATPGPFQLAQTDEVAADLEWFIRRYPLRISDGDAELLTLRAEAFRKGQAEIEVLLSAGRAPQEFKINGQLREYQARGVELYLKTKRLLLGDAVGIGKTLQAIGSFTEPATLPALVVVQAHLPTQWATQIVRFLSAKFHVMKGTRPYPLPHADVYITTYSRLAGWVDVLCSMGLKSLVFDEIQELRREDSQKYQAAAAVSARVDYCLGLSATPIYNYGDEIYNILQIIRPGSLGERSEFSREWCGFEQQVKDPKALGTYLREHFLFLRRTRDDVKRELPPVNKIVHTVGHDEEAVQKVEDVARALATRVMTGSFQQRGEAARELDVMMRMVTGVSKAKFVAEYVRILLENDEPVLLVGWHRDVYEIWLKELAEFKPVMFTGSESPSQKEQARWMFTSGKTNLMIMSLRSGIGLDGLQHRCRYVVFGELDWSPAVHEQVTGRIDRDGQQNQVTSIYLVSEGGSDPLLVDMLGIKASQAAGVVDPFGAHVEVHSDGSRIKALAELILRRKPGDPQKRSTPAAIAELPRAPEQVALEGL